MIVYLSKENKYGAKLIIESEAKPLIDLFIGRGYKECSEKEWEIISKRSDGQNKTFNTWERFDGA